MTSQPTSAVERSFDVGGRLRMLREVLGLSQREVARRAGMTNANLSQIEQGKVSPSLVSLERLLSAFPLSLAEFFSNLPLIQQVVVREAELDRWAHNECSFSGIHTTLNSRESLTLTRIVLRPQQELKLTWKVSNRLVKGLVLLGRIELALEQECWTLMTGDAFRFSAHRQHLLANREETSTELVVVAVQKTS